MIWGYYSGTAMSWWMVLGTIVLLGLFGVAVWAPVRWVTHLTTAPGGPPGEWADDGAVCRGNPAAAVCAGRD